MRSTGPSLSVPSVPAFAAVCCPRRGAISSRPPSLACVASAWHSMEASGVMPGARICRGEIAMSLANTLAVASLAAVLSLCSIESARAQTTSGAAASSPASSSAGVEKNCGAVLTAAGFKAGTGITDDQVCTTLTDAIKGTAAANAGSGGTTIGYTQEDQTFYRALGKSIRRHGGKEPVLVNMGLPNSPVVTVDTLRAETAPSYNEIGLGLWVERVQKAGGKYCTIETDQIAPALILAVFEFLAKDAVPFLLDKYHLQQAYKKAEVMDVLVGYNTTGAEKGRIMWMKFVPRGSVPCKAAA